MSVVAVRVYDDGIHVASDSIITRGWTKQKDRFVKMFQTKDMVVGSVGSAEEIGLFRIFLQTHNPKSASEDDLLTLFAEFHEWVYKRFDDRKYAFSNAWIVVVGTAAYYAHGYFVNRVLDYEAIGAGEDFALAAMAMGLSPTQAIQAACEHSVYCSLPVNEFIIPIVKDM